MFENHEQSVVIFNRVSLMLMNKFEIAAKV